MKNIKDITISIFAIIGFVAIVTGFTNEAEQPQQMYATPESHVWAMMQTSAESIVTLNKQTGEIRFVKKNGYEVIRQKQKLSLIHI